MSFGEIPFRTLNQYGRLIDFDEGSYWEDIEVTDWSKRTHFIKIDSFESDLLEGTLETEFSGYHAHDKKRRFHENPVVYKSKKVDLYDNLEIPVLEADTESDLGYTIGDVVCFLNLPHLKIQ